MSAAARLSIVLRYPILYHRHKYYYCVIIACTLLTYYWVLRINSTISQCYLN